METHFNNSGDHMAGRGELPLKPNLLVAAEKSLADWLRFIQLNTIAGEPVTPVMSDLAQVRKKIVEIHTARHNGDLTPKCKGYRASELSRLKSQELVLEAQLRISNKGGGQ